MSHLKSPKELWKFGLPVQLIDLLEEYRFFLEDGNAYEYWEDVTVTTPSSPDTEFEARTVYLNKTPNYAQILKSDKAAAIYRDSNATVNERNKIFLKCNVASATLTLRVFV